MKTTEKLEEEFMNTFGGLEGYSGSGNDLLHLATELAKKIRTPAGPVSNVAVPKTSCTLKTRLSETT